jgi:hypothetical protein
MRTVIQVSFMFLWAGGLAHAQQVTGLSLLDVDEPGGEVNSYAETDVGYEDSFYYVVRLDSSMVGIRFDSQEHLTARSCHVSDPYDPFVICGFTMEWRPGYIYRVSSTHKVDVYFRYYEIDPYCGMDCNSWYDLEGYWITDPPCGRDESGEPIPCETDTVFRAWVSAYPILILVQRIVMGDTTDRVALAPPVLTCTPGTVTRAGTVTCSVTGSGQVASWSFSGGDGTASGPAGNRTWSGKMVVSGTVTVNITGYSTPLQAIINVNARSGWHTQPASPAPVPNGSIVYKGQVQTLPVPPQPTSSDSGLGVYGWEAARSAEGYTIVPGGPNKDFVYWASPPSFSSFFFKYTINPDLENSGSAFATHQWGRCGFVSYSDLLTQTRRHEYNHATQSHYGKYVTALNNANNNFGDYLESNVASPQTNPDFWAQATTNELSSRDNRIDNATKIEPYAVNESATGSFLGEINYALVDCQ